MTPLLRLAREDDLPAIVALLADDDLGSTREDAGLPLDEGYLHAFAAIAADPAQELIVMEIDGAVAGTMQLTFIPGLSHRGRLRCLIEAVRVASRLRGHGLGRVMIVHAEARALARGAGMLQLTSNKSRTAAHRFYESLGYSMSHEGFKREIPLA